MSKLLALRGISGSGKSTYAFQLKLQGWVVVSRDDIREFMFRDYQSVDEEVVTKVEDAAIDAALAAGQNVVIDDTNIRLKFLKRFAEIAAKHNALFQVREFDCGVNTAINRVFRRVMHGGRDVPEGVIRKQAQGLKSAVLDWTKIYPEVIVPDRYELPGGPDAILVDVDGTLAHNDGHRSFYDYSKVYGDKVKEEVADIVRTHYYSKRRVIIMSGRDDSCESETRRWLLDNMIPFHEIHMRTTGDMRKDNLVKLDLFNEHVRYKYDVQFVLDDRQQVVDMWRSLGLTCLQVAPGNF